MAATATPLIYDFLRHHFGTVKDVVLREKTLASWPVLAAGALVTFLILDQVVYAYKKWRYGYAGPAFTVPFLGGIAEMGEYSPALHKQRATRTNVLAAPAPLLSSAGDTSAAACTNCGIMRTKLMHCHPSTAGRAGAEALRRAAGGLRHGHVSGQWGGDPAPVAVACGPRMPGADAAPARS